MFKSSGTLTSIIVQDSVFLSHIIMSGQLCGIFFLGSDTGLSLEISKSLNTVIGLGSLNIFCVVFSFSFIMFSNMIFAVALWRIFK